MCKLEANFNFDNLKGKGEVPSYIYIFSKRNVPPMPFGSHVGELGSFGLNNLNLKLQKESCLSFRSIGQLVQFKEFSKLFKELKDFLNKKSPHSTPIYQQDVTEKLIFQFHQDAILEGKFACNAYAYWLSPLLVLPFYGHREHGLFED